MIDELRAAARELCAEPDRHPEEFAEGNRAKLRASDVSWAAANARLATELDVERTAPVANNLVLAYVGHNVLGMPKSY